MPVLLGRSELAKLMPEKTIRFSCGPYIRQLARLIFLLLLVKNEKNSLVSSFNLTCWRNATWSNFTWMMIDPISLTPLSWIRYCLIYWPDKIHLIKTNEYRIWNILKEREWKTYFIFMPSCFISGILLIFLSIIDQHTS